MARKKKNKLKYEYNGEIFAALWDVIDKSFKGVYKTMKIYNFLLENEYITEQWEPLCEDIQLTGGVLYINFGMLLTLKREDSLDKDDDGYKYIEYN